ncbi:bifunctional (p)ppGpp synthetase/guanosine-3',5'-bis(diphosphate) 3'-pyrophosphohydrolase [bacterium]|nr:bifunctional (p)ppGpp synthetase/guanosine-3',5'-bis(diphosphate) 3'-pyrophosphohydrolase [bacterium]
MAEDKLVQKIKKKIPPKFLEEINGCINVAEEKYKGMYRYNGNTLLSHSLRVADNLLDIEMDTYTAMAAILHEVPYKELSAYKEIPRDVIKLVKGVQDIKEITNATDTTPELIIKYILATTEDIRSIFIKIYDKYHDLKTFDNIPEDYKKITLFKALNIYGVLAEYLGLDSIKKKIEEIAFSYSLPVEYNSISKKLDSLNVCNDLLNQYKGRIAQCVSPTGIEYDVSCRIKNKYSIYKKLKKYEKEWIDPNTSRLDDIIAFRLITDTEDNCYKILEKLMDNGILIEDRFDDYISNPKPNGYKAVQFPIQFLDISPLNIEIQILTRDMYYYNTYGPASHIAYKASQSRYAKATDEYKWVEDIQNKLKILRKNRSKQDNNPIQCKIFADNVLVLTPMHKIIELDKGDTVLDFAFMLHTGIGNSATSAKVNGKPVALNYEPKTGDTIEIKVDKNKTHQKVSMLEYAHSSSTKNKIIKYLNQANT